MDSNSNATSESGFSNMLNKKFSKFATKPKDKDNDKESEKETKFTK